MTLHVTLIHLQKFLSLILNKHSAENDQSQGSPTKKPSFISEHLEIRPVDDTGGEPVSPS